MARRYDEEFKREAVEKRLAGTHLNIKIPLRGLFHQRLGYFQGIETPYPYPKRASDFCSFYVILQRSRFFSGINC
jgi:hypothetical protein